MSLETSLSIEAPSFVPSEQRTAFSFPLPTAVEPPDATGAPVRPSSERAWAAWVHENTSALPSTAS